MIITLNSWLITGGGEQIWHARIRRPWPSACSGRRDSELLCRLWLSQAAPRAQPKFIASRVVHTAFRRVQGPRPASKQGKKKKKKRTASALTSSIFHPPPLPEMLNLLPLFASSQARAARGLEKSHYSYTCGGKKTKKKQATYIDCRGQYKPAGVLIFTPYEVIILF